MIGWLVTVAAALTFADLASGLVHWWEDRYGDPAWPVLGPLVVRPNIVHHERPREFLRVSYWQRNYTTLVPALVAAVLAWRVPWLCLGLVILSQSNELHAWAHSRCSWPVRMAQRAGLIQSPRHHAQHHAQPFGSHYCVVTDWLNPLLEAVRFWRGLEWCVWLVSGVWPRPARELA